MHPEASRLPAAAEPLIHQQEQMCEKQAFPASVPADVHLLKQREDSGGDALRGNTRTHPEHEG